MGFFRDLKNLLTTGSRAPSEDGRSGDREVDNVDAGAAAAASHGQARQGSAYAAGPSYPPGYVKAYDEGRPRK